MMKWIILSVALLSVAGMAQADPLKVGDSVPEVTVMNQDGQPVTLSGLKGKWVVLYFYPKDDTPGCRREAETFTRLKPAFDKQQAVILGISTDDAASHRKFIRKRGLAIDLLVDPERTLMKLFDVRVRLGFCSRDTVLINPEGKVEKIYRGVSPEGNPEEILAYLRHQSASD